ncbi:MAG: 3-isopropylmalate dehydratase [Caulobacterales bacterium]
MTLPSEGRAFVFGDRVDTDVLAPGALMKLAPPELARHCLAALDPTFAASVRPGDFVVAGDGFGIGSSREQAAQSLVLLGVRAVIAKSFARIFYRNAYNLGLPAVILPQAGEIVAGDRLSLDVAGGRVVNHSTGLIFDVAPIPQRLAEMIEAGGLVAQLRAGLLGARE